MAATREGKRRVVVVDATASIPADGPKLPCRLSDISPSGARVVFTMLPSVGSSGELSMWFGIKECRAPFAVAWIEGDLTGITFLPENEVACEHPVANCEQAEG